nr:MAG TPA: hypothetical protein [Caudoviricetes sp.]
MWLNFAACAFCCLCSTTPPYARLAIAPYAHSGICSEICNHVNDFVLSLVGGYAKREHGNCQKQKTPRDCEVPRLGASVGADDLCLKGVIQSPA